MSLTQLVQWLRRALKLTSYGALAYIVTLVLKALRRTNGRLLELPKFPCSSLTAADTQSRRYKRYTSAEYLYGNGEGMDMTDTEANSVWRRHLMPSQRLTAAQCLAAVSDMVYSTARSPANELTMSQLIEGVRRLWLYCTWPNFSTKKALPSRQQCEAVVGSLLKEAEIDPASLPRDDPALDHTEAEPTATVTFPSGQTETRRLWHSPHIPSPGAIKVPLWVVYPYALSMAATRIALNCLGWQSRWVTTSWGEMHVYDSGEDEGAGGEDDDAPPLLLVHGVFVTSHAVLGLATALRRRDRAGQQRRRRRVLVPDLLDFDWGFSQSGAAGRARVAAATAAASRHALGEAHPAAVDFADVDAAGCPSAVTLVDPLVELCQELGVPRVDICGHSLGGFVAQSLAAAHPELVRRVVLLSPAGGGRYNVVASLRGIANEHLTHELLPPYALPPQQWLRALVVPAMSAGMRIIQHSPSMAHLIQSLNYRKLDCLDPRPYCEHAERGRAGAPSSALAQPTLVVCGTEDTMCP
jgi:pimeloyl-ACP methyl ester carboxylesterase